MISSYFKNNFQILCFSVCAARNEIMGSQERVTLYYLIRSYSTISLLFTRINITNTCTCMLILSILGFWLSSVNSSLCQGWFPTKDCCQDWFSSYQLFLGSFKIRISLSNLNRSYSRLRLRTLLCHLNWTTTIQLYLSFL